MTFHMCFLYNNSMNQLYPLTKYSKNSVRSFLNQYYYLALKTNLLDIIPPEIYDNIISFLLYKSGTRKKGNNRYKKRKILQLKLSNLIKNHCTVTATPLLQTRRGKRSLIIYSRHLQVYMKRKQSYEKEQRLLAIKQQKLKHPRLQKIFKERDRKRKQKLRKIQQNRTNVTVSL